MAVPQQFDAMNVKTRSGVTPGLKMSLIVSRPSLPMVKFGSTVMRIVSPGPRPPGRSGESFQGMAISWT